MTIDCMREPPVIAFAKTFGASIGILGAAAAWLLNRFFGWCVWFAGRRLERHEAMKAIRAEISDNLRSEIAYAGLEKGNAFIGELEADLTADAPLAPYVAVEERNVLFDDIAKSVPTLPSEVIESVIAYYSASAGLTRQLIDFRSESFRSISRARQRAVIKDTFAEGAKVCELGKAALARMDSEIQSYEYAIVWAYASGLLGLVGLVFLLAVPLPLGAKAISAAVEWASTCDLAPKLSK